MHLHQEKEHPEFWAVKFAAKQAIKAHLSCEVCGKQFAWKIHLTNHMKAHSNNKDVVCDLCGKAFVEKNSLAKHHVRMHGTEKEKE